MASVNTNMGSLVAQANMQTRKSYEYSDAKTFFWS